MNENKLLEKGLVEFEEGRLDQALQTAKKLQTEEPTNSEGFHLEGLIEQSRQNWEQSIEAFTKAIIQSPYDPSLYNFRGFAHMSLGNLVPADVDFREAIDLEDFEPAHRNHTLWLIINDRIDEAVEYLTVRIQLKQDDAENFLLMGDLLSRAGYTERGQTYFDKAKELTSK